MQASITQLDSLYDEYIWSTRWPPRCREIARENPNYMKRPGRGVTLDLVASDSQSYRYLDCAAMGIT
jgi:hypothetical protein